MRVWWAWGAVIVPVGAWAQGVPAPPSVRGCPTNWPAFFATSPVARAGFSDAHLDIRCSSNGVRVRASLDGRRMCETSPSADVASRPSEFDVEAVLLPPLARALRGAPDSAVRCGPIARARAPTPASTRSTDDAPTQTTPPEPWWAEDDAVIDAETSAEQRLDSEFNARSQPPVVASGSPPQRTQVGAWEVGLTGAWTRTFETDTSGGHAGLDGAWFPSQRVSRLRLRVGIQGEYGRHFYGALGTTDHVGGALWLAVGAALLDTGAFRLDADLGARLGLFSLRPNATSTAESGDTLDGWYLAPLARMEASWRIDHVRLGLVAELEWVPPGFGVVGYVARGFARTTTACSNACDAVGLTGFATLAGVRVAWSR